MPAEIHLELFTAESERRIDAESFLRALDSSLALLQELDRGVSGGKFHWYYTRLEVGSGLSTLTGEITDENMPASTREAAERRIETLYVDGLKALDTNAQMPTGFTRKAAEEVQHMVAILSDSVKGMETYSPRVGKVAITERIVANLKAVLGHGFTDFGAVEGRLETISLAGKRPTFNIRDELTGESVTCSFKIERLTEVKEALGERVLVSGEVTYSKRREASEVSPIETIRLLGKVELPSAEDRGGLVCLNSAARFDKWNRAAVR